MRWVQRRESGPYEGAWYRAVEGPYVIDVTEDTGPIEVGWSHSTWHWHIRKDDRGWDQINSEPLISLEAAQLQASAVLLADMEATPCE